MNRFIAVAVAVVVLALMTLVGRQVLAADDDQKVVAALDTEYQAAVKKNDAATMDRILADDFVLVTASGKTYTKTDLLNEARGGRTAYEHQEDTMQTVRVWGGTAVVTAKLWEKGTDDGKPLTTCCGSVTPTFGRPMDGDMCSRNPRIVLARSRRDNKYERTRCRHSE